MFQLICEGPCNPEIVAIDAAVSAFRRERDRSAAGRMAPLPERLVHALRALHYTAHWSCGLTGERATCDDCGHERRFGGRAGA